MKTWISAIILPLALAAGVCAQTASNGQLNSITRDQRGVDARVDELTKAYQALLVQMRALGTAREDLVLVENSLKELASIRQQDMARILSRLETAAATPGDSAPLASTLTDQKVVAARLRSLVARLQLRQQELALAQRAKELADRQAANHPRTADLKSDTNATNSNRVLADAEQQGIREEALSLAEQIQRLRADPQMTPSPTLERLSQPANLEGLRSAANAAATQLKSGDFPGAYAQQALLLDRLLRLSELGRRTPAPAEAAKAAAAAVKDLLHDQQTLASSEKPDPAKQAELAARTEALRPQIDGVLAAAGSQVGQAAEAMNPKGDTPPAADQATQHLETASDLLNKQAEKLAAAEAAKPPETPATQTAEADQLALFAREALVLQKNQEQLNASVAAATPPPVANIDRDQTDLVRRTAALQQQVQQAGNIAASSLGQAAVRMSEALSTANPAPTVQLAGASRQTAVERLAEAVALLTAAAKDQQAQAALANTQQAAQNAAAQLAQATQNLQQAQQQTQQGETQAAQQSQQAAQQNLQQAQQSLQQAGQAGAQIPQATQQAMSQSWQATQQAQQQAQQGNPQAAQQSAQAAQAALQQAQGQLAQQAQQQGQGQQNQNQNQPGSPDQQMASNQPPQAGTPGGLSQVDNNINVRLAGSGADAGATVAATLSRAEREALAAARHQPVARAYTAQVEAYLDNLAEATDSR